MKKILRTNLLLVLFISVFSAGNMDAQIKEVTAETVKKTLATEKNWVVLDVRTPEEFSQGHIPGAVNINLYQNDAMDKIAKLNKNDKYIVYCRTRNRSGVVAEHMVKNGFKTVHQMVDGIGGWNQVNSTRN
jgi:rhodanese-related sulfurtransferase